MGITGGMLRWATDDKRVLWVPGQAHVLAIGQGFGGSGGVQVLGVDRQPMAVGGLDQVLGAYPDVAGIQDGAGQDVLAVEISTKPLIGLVWFGMSLLLGGAVLGIGRRLALRRQEVYARAGAMVPAPAEP